MLSSNVFQNFVQVGWKSISELINVIEMIKSDDVNKILKGISILQIWDGKSPLPS